MLKLIRFIPALIVSTVLLACQQNQPSEAPNETATNSNTVEKKVHSASKSISSVRKVVKQDAVDNFSKKVPDSLNDWSFAVDAFETKSTFNYLLKIKYKEIRVSDSIRLPNFGIEPQIKLTEGKEPFSCLVGFIDKKGTFRDMRKIFIENDQLRIKSTHHYKVTAYQVPQ